MFRFQFSRTIFLVQTEKRNTAGNDSFNFLLKHRNRFGKKQKGGRGSGIRTAVQLAWTPPFTMWA